MFKRFVYRFVCLWSTTNRRTDKYGVPEKPERCTGRFKMVQLKITNDSETGRDTKRRVMRDSNTRTRGRSFTPTLLCDTRVRLWRISHVELRTVSAPRYISGNDNDLLPPNRVGKRIVTRPTIVEYFRAFVAEVKVSS